MEIENAANTPAPEPDNSPMFVDVVADLIGDHRHQSAASDDDTSRPENAEGSEAVAPTEPAGATPDTAVSDPADPVVPTTSDDDYFKDAKPLAYRVNGEERTFDGINVLPDGTAIIEKPDALQYIQQRLSERDHLFETNQQRHAESEQLKAEYASATRWKLDDGREVSGREGAQAKDLAYALNRAERDTYNALLSDPGKIASLLMTDAAGNIVWNDANVALVQAQLENKKLQLTHAVQQHYAQRPVAPVAPTPAGGTPKPDASAVAEHLVSTLGVKGFGADDKVWLASLAEEMVRPATAQDVSQNPLLKVGEFFAPPRMIALMNERSTLLARSAKQVETATQVDRENQARLRAANQGGKGPKAPPTPVTPIRKPEQPTRAETQDERWDREQNASAALLRSAAR